MEEERSKVGSPAIGPEPPGSVLSGRGFKIEDKGNLRDILLPLDSPNTLKGGIVNEFRRLFGHSSFRKTIRNITAGGGRASLAKLREISGDDADRFVQFLVELEVAEWSGNQVNLLRSLNNIGPTLEWYVADLVQKQFGGSADWSVKLADCAYGDYDVIGWLPPTLLYLEAKSARPSGIDDSELKNFLQRGVELAPELAISLIDTDDDLEATGSLDRIFNLMIPSVKLSSRITDADWRPAKPFIAPAAGFPGISFGLFRYYVTNSEPSIEGQIRRCLRHYHTNVKGHTFYHGEPMNFVTDK